MIFKNAYLPEGCLYETERNHFYIGSLAGLERAMREDAILEASAMLCDEARNLHIGLCAGAVGIIPQSEVLSLRPGGILRY